MALSLHIVAPGAPCNLRAAEYLTVWVGAPAIADTAIPTAAGEWALQCVRIIPEGLYASKTEWDLLVPFCTNCYTKCWVCSLHSGCLRMVPSCGLSVPQIFHQTSGRASFKDVVPPWILPCVIETWDTTPQKTRLCYLWYFWNSMLPVYLRPLYSQRCMGKETGILFLKYHIYLPSFYSVIHNCFLPVFWT